MKYYFILLLSFVLTGCDVDHCSRGNELNIDNSHATVIKQVFTKNDCNNLSEFDVNVDNDNLVYLAAYQEDSKLSTVIYSYLDNWDDSETNDSFTVNIQSFENSSLGELVAKYVMDYTHEVLTYYPSDGNGVFQYYPDDDEYKNIESQFGLEQTTNDFNTASLYAKKKI